MTATSTGSSLITPPPWPKRGITRVNPALPTPPSPILSGSISATRARAYRDFLPTFVLGAVELLSVRPGSTHSSSSSSSSSCSCTASEVQSVYVLALHSQDRRSSDAWIHHNHDVAAGRTPCGQQV
ncbi:unnamed protein product, partial [Ectocarpus sp. 8 AP-2014]